MNELPSPARFPTTRWSCVALAGGPATPEARAALAELCGAYWYPIHALIRRKGHGAEESRDRDRALRRGGGRPLLSIDARDAEGRFLREPSTGPLNGCSSATGP